MEILEKELMQRWKEERPEYLHFNEDGIVNYEVWNQTKLHILFVLKETNGLCGSLSTFLKFGGSPTYWRTWNNIARWTDMLLNHHYSEYITKDFLQEMLSHIAIMNLKKESGGSRANKKEIRKYALSDKELLLEQMQLYQPNVIVTCGFNLVSDIVHDDILAISEKWMINEKAGLYFYQTDKITEGKRIPVISMPHPNRASKEWTKKLEELINLEKL